MPTEVVAVDAPNPDLGAIERAADVIRRGGLVAFPTETVYGLGADATNPAAVERIFQAKGRPPTNPTIIHVADIDAANACSASWPPAADELASAFWPGPLTVIVPAAPGVLAPAALAGGTTVGLRVPSHPVALALLRAASLPIAAPSANRSESLSPTTAQHVLRTLDGRIEMILDAGPTTGGVESTVIDLSESPPRLLRPGLVSVEQLRGLLPNLQVVVSTDATTSPKSPGQMPRHYAPSTPLEIVTGPTMLLDQWFNSKVGVVTFGWMPETAEMSDRRVHRPMPADPAAAARMLYAVLHELDAMGLDRILVESPPPGDDWSAIRDRLQRASTPKE